MMCLIVLKMITLALYLLISYLYFDFYRNRLNITLKNTLLAPVFILILKSFIWWPNILGYWDEVR